MENEVLESLPEDHIPQSAAEAEQLIGQWESPEVETPVEQNPKQAIQTPQQLQAPKLEKYTFKRFGKDVEVELSPEKRLEYLQQGFDYSDKMRALREAREQHAREIQSFGDQKASLERLKQYQEIEDYQKQDPAWWEHVVSSYQQRQEAQGQQQAPPALVKKVEELSQFVSQQREQAQLAERAKEDGELDKTISDYRAAHPDFDWNVADENGQDLEKRIIEHAISLGITKASGFKAAADSYLLEKHLEKAKLGAKENLGKTIQKQAKLGLGPVTAKRTIAPQGVKNVRAKSYEDIMAEIHEKENLA